VSITDFLSILFIAIGLSADCFAVALSSSISRSTLSSLQMLRVALSFGIFQAVMPVLGWLAGNTIVEFISDYDHWLAFGLLGLIGGRMVWESFRSRDSKSTDVTKGFMLLTLSIATSIDALAVGLSFAFLKVNITMATVTIGITTFLITMVGLLLGKKVGGLVGKRAECIGGVILFGIGIKILVEHML
jgi:putative Mn2+ efflux pump MntP